MRTVGWEGEEGETEGEKCVESGTQVDVVRRVGETNTVFDEEGWEKKMEDENGKTE